MAAVGFAYFLPAELLFSLWSFFWFVRLENVVFSALGSSYEAMPLYPTTIWNGYQVAGAYLVLVGYMAKAAWPHLRHVWQRAVSLAPKRQTDREFLPYQAAVFGLGFAVVVSVVWFAKLGITPVMAALEALIYVLVVVPVMARSVSEAGMLMTETSFRPVDLVRLFSTQARLGASTLTGLSLADAVFTRDLRGNLLSTFLDGLKMSEVVKLDRRALLYAIAMAIAVALIVGGYLHLTVPYQLGAVSMYHYVYQGNSIYGFQHFAPVLQFPDKYDSRLPVFFASGVGLTLLLTVMRSRYTWWPLAPLGFVLSGSWSMIVFWFPFLVAWFVKWGIVHYGGMRIYNQLRPFFLGLILGEFSQAVIWATIGGIWRLPAPFFPWP